MAWTMEEHDWEADRLEYERIRARFPELVTRGFQCMGGWYPILESMFEDIRKALPEGDEEHWSLLQVKEKWAGLSVYYSFKGNDEVGREIGQAVRLAQARADHRCEVCGKRGSVRKRRALFMQRCDEHADGGVVAPEWRGENTVYGIGGKHYHFDPDRDQFVEIDNE